MNVYMNRNYATVVMVTNTALDVNKRSSAHMIHVCFFVMSSLLKEDKRRSEKYITLFTSSRVLSWQCYLYQICERNRKVGEYNVISEKFISFEYFC